MRIILVGLLLALISALPLWPYNSQWSYGPAIAMAFLVTVNLIVMACNANGGRDRS
jgi:peptidoglycan/LPS O-acetylase OafA/YrhL